MAYVMRPRKDFDSFIFPDGLWGCSRFFVHAHLASNLCFPPALFASDSSPSTAVPARLPLLALDSQPLHSSGSDPLDQPTLGPLPTPLLNCSSLDQLDQLTLGPLYLPPPDRLMTTTYSSGPSFLDYNPEDPPEERPLSRGPQSQPATFGEKLRTKRASEAASADANGSSGASDASGAVSTAANLAPSTLVPLPAATAAVAAPSTAGESGMASAASDSAASSHAASSDSAAAVAVPAGTGDPGTPSDDDRELEADLVRLREQTAAADTVKREARDRLDQVSAEADLEKQTEGLQRQVTAQRAESKKAAQVLRQRQD